MVTMLKATFAIGRKIFINTEIKPQPERVISDDRDKSRQDKEKRAVKKRESVKYNIYKNIIKRKC